MGKKDAIHELTNILARALRHKIGSIVNANEVYAKRYAKDADILMKEVKKVAIKINWNNHDKIKLKDELERKLRDGLEKRDFLDNKKFDIMDEEMDKALEELKLLPNGNA